MTAQRRARRRRRRRASRTLGRFCSAVEWHQETVYGVASPRRTPRGLERRQEPVDHLAPRAARRHRPHDLAATAGCSLRRRPGGLSFSTSAPARSPPKKRPRRNINTAQAHRRVARAAAGRVAARAGSHPRATASAPLPMGGAVSGSLGAQLDAHRRRCGMHQPAQRRGHRLRASRPAGSLPEHLVGGAPTRDLTASLGRRCFDEEYGEAFSIARGQARSCSSRTRRLLALSGPIGMRSPRRDHVGGVPQSWATWSPPRTATSSPTGLAPGRPGVAGARPPPPVPLTSARDGDTTSQAKERSVVGGGVEPASRPVEVCHRHQPNVRQPSTKAPRIVTTRQSTRPATISGSYATPATSVKTTTSAASRTPRPASGRAVSG